MARSPLRFSSGAAALPSHARTVLGHASLTGQGLAEFNAGAEGGDNEGIYFGGIAPGRRTMLEFAVQSQRSC
jgi:hypothetical protein